MLGRRTVAITLMTWIGLCLASSLELDAEQVRIRLESTDLQGAPVSAVNLGEEFLIHAYVQDIRPDQAVGVFASYMDFTYPEALAALSEIRYAEPYTNGHRQNASVPGLVYDVGAFGGLGTLDNQEYLLATIEFNATQIGNGLFAADPADTPVGADILLYGLNDIVSPSLVDYGHAMVSVYPENCDVGVASGLVGDLDGDQAIGFTDFVLLSNYFGQAVDDHRFGDINCDGAVGFADFLVLSDNFGQQAAPSSAVPEPATGLALLMVAVLARRRRVLSGRPSGRNG